MADILPQLNDLDAAQYGKTARTPIASALTKINSDEVYYHAFPADLKSFIETLPGKDPDYYLSIMNSIGKCAFENTINLKSVSFSNVSTIGSSAFAGCINLSTASFPSVTKICNDAFNGCVGLKYMHFSEVSEIGSSAFFGCTSLLDVAFGSFISIIYPMAFYNCKSFSAIYFHGFSSLTIYDNALPTAIRDLVLDSDAIPEIVVQSGNAWPNPLYVEFFKVGRTFVPSSMISLYKVSSGWSDIWNEYSAFNPSFFMAIDQEEEVGEIVG